MRNVVLVIGNPRHDLMGYTRKDTISLLFAFFLFWMRDYSWERSRELLLFVVRFERMGVNRMGTTRSNTTCAIEGVGAVMYSIIVAILVVIQ